MTDNRSGPRLGLSSGGELVSFMDVAEHWNMDVTFTGPLESLGVLHWQSFNEGVETARLRARAAGASEEVLTAIAGGSQRDLGAKPFSTSGDL